MKKIFCAVTNYNTDFKSPEQKKAFLKAISLLPEDQQKVLQLYYEKQLSIKEIALQLDYSCTTIYNKHYRALYALRLEFNPEAFAKINHILYGQMAAS